MSAKGLALAATVALLGLSLGGCVDGGPYYGAYTYSEYYGPAYYDPYYGPYYGGVIYGGYRDGYHRSHHHRHRYYHSQNGDHRDPVAHHRVSDRDRASYRERSYSANYNHGDRPGIRRHHGKDEQQQ
jgi:hypothetical protein